MALHSLLRVPVLRAFARPACIWKSADDAANDILLPSATTSDVSSPLTKLSSSFFIAVARTPNESGPSLLASGSLVAFLLKLPSVPEIVGQLENLITYASTASAEAMTLELANGLAQPLALRPLGAHHRLQKTGIIRAGHRLARLPRQWITDVRSLRPFCATPSQLVAVGTAVARGSCTRRQSSPSS